jgi:hypothetical protein
MFARWRRRLLLPLHPRLEYTAYLRRLQKNKIVHQPLQLQHSFVSPASALIQSGCAQLVDTLSAQQITTTPEAGIGAGATQRTWEAWELALAKVSKE